MRHDGRRPDELRPLTFERGYTRQAPGSVRVLDGAELLDLDYREDRDADVDLNLVMTGAGDIIEVQAGGEEATFRRDQLDRLLNLGKLGVDAVTRLQRQTLGPKWCGA